MRVIYRPAATADLDEILTYLGDENPTGALRVWHAIHAQVGRLAIYPELGRPGRVPGTRELVIARTPYIAPYSINEVADTVYVIRILHGARLWPHDFEPDP